VRLMIDDKTRNEIAESLERLADEPTWNPEVWQRCYDLVTTHWDDELLGYVWDDITHYDGEFHPRNIFAFHAKAGRHQLDGYGHTFRSIAAALRSSLSLSEAKKKYGL
jgi:hypothetical protein